LDIEIFLLDFTCEKNYGCSAIQSYKEPKMKLTEIFKKDSIKVGLSAEGKTKAQVIHEMVDVLAGSFGLNEMQVEAVNEAIMYRERQKSTGMEKGVAIPHGKTEHVDGLIAAMGIYADGIDFDSLDCVSSQYIVLMVSDFKQSTEHVQALAQVMRILQREQVARDVLGAKTGIDVFRILKEEESH
jgi:mannitol/fructose-specific phosphotransferase system IIA component (Ntr-type)